MEPERLRLVAFWRSESFFDRVSKSLSWEIAFARILWSINRYSFWRFSSCFLCPRLSFNISISFVVLSYPYLEYLTRNPSFAAPACTYDSIVYCPILFLY